MSRFRVSHEDLGEGTFIREQTDDDGTLYLVLFDDEKHRHKWVWPEEIRWINSTQAKFEDVAPSLSEHLASIVPWLHPAMLTIANSDWLVERRVAVLQAAARIIINEFIDQEVAPPRDGIEALGKYVIEAAKELAEKHRQDTAEPEPYKIPDHVLETSECS